MLYDSAYRLADELGLAKLKANILFNGSSLSEEMGDTSRALVLLRQYVNLKNDLFGKEKTKLLSEHQKGIGIIEKNREISLLKKQEEINKLKYKRLRLIVLVVIITIVLALIIAVLAYKMKKQKVEEDLEVLRSQLVRSQMTPHFIFNTLMGIETILMANEVEKAMEYIVDFAYLVRSVLINSKESTVSLAAELETVEQYLKLEKMRFGDKFDYQIDKKFEHRPEEIDIPPMLIQPFLENSIVHGFYGLTDRKGLIRLTLTQSGKKLTIIIEDNGIGRAKAAEKRKHKGNHKSLATELTKNRIKLLKKRLKMDVRFTIEDVKDNKGNVAGTRVVFEMDYQ